MTDGNVILRNSPEARRILVCQDTYAEITKFIYLVFCILSLASSSFASVLVKNVRFSQREGTNLVDIYYDLIDTEGGKEFLISLSLSADGGKNFTIIPRTLAGDYGSKISPGKNKHILWDAGADFDSLVGDNFVFKITATRPPSPGASRPFNSSPGASRPGLTYLGKNAKGYEEYRHNKTGIILIKIPAGEFWMGSPPGEGDDDEHPQHKVYLDEYYIAKYEVTNEQFERFVRATGYKTDAEKEGSRNWRYYYSRGREKHPVVLVSWNDAKAFCEWAGLRLPTEAEWEKAARGTDGRRYPWGNQWDDNKCCSWYTDRGLLKSKPGYVDMGKGRSTVPVGSFRADVSPYGCYDMAGNVWEWCADWYDGGYYSRSPYRNPKGPSSGAYRVVRGGSWYYGSRICRSAYRCGRNPAGGWSVDGFRVASPP